MVLACWGTWGCSSHGPKDFERVSFAPVTTVAVAPAMNFSGRAVFDPVQVADWMASELGSVPGIGVVGVNRVLAVLAEDGLDRIQSPEHAVEVCSRLGTDQILVFAVTEYDPYPPIVGIAAQMYGNRSAEPAIDPVATSRMTRPFRISDGDPHRPWAQTQRTFNGVHEAVHHELRDYAASRGEDDSPYGWKKYLVSQNLYVRFCCFSVARELMQQQVAGIGFVETAASQEP